MKLAAFDIGGTSVKTGIFENNKIGKLDNFPVPPNFLELIAHMHSVIDNTKVDGIAISSPGNVDSKNRIIRGVSAVPYLHHRPIFDELENEFKLPVAIENDANCAGICEMRIGNGRPYKNVVFVVVGTGVGGSIFINRQIYKGSHLFGGEFGQMKVKSGQTLSFTGTIVNAVRLYRKKSGQPCLDGQNLFALAASGDSIAKNIIDSVYDNLAISLYNLQVSFDFEAIIIGGGISARPEFCLQISKRIKNKLDEWGALEIMPKIIACKYHNAANLYGACFNYMDQIK
ncbi:ROK family protein [Lactobacillus sp. ESL0677]|uniref:ROK family protein n=1 Tax=Lactobacillus sp. ESL0677 TaxID=2983208 RepID=UPI0023F7B3A7|nr:ROK family protein [Lactobacillus sp. ESL0677]WEV37639.1 ROK family protein [Lactobacillus sp. ESL0677]